MDLDADIDLYVKAALGKKAIAPVLLDVRDLTSFADVFMICSGRSNRQVSAIADNIRVELKTQGIHPLSVEGKKDGHWVLMDYGHVVIHVFYESTRRFFDLEGLWADAPRVSTPSLDTYAELQENREPFADDTDDIDHS
jgi:ribosome-associated protein